MTDANQDSLLPGEDEAVRSGRSDDARLWAAVYDELSKFKENLLRTIEEQRGKARPEALAEVRNDEKLLRDEAARLTRRLEFWRAEVARRN